LDECGLINDDLAEVQAKYTGKLVGLAQTPVLEGEEALQEIDRAIRSLSLKGVTITSQIKGVSLDSPKLYGLYEKACDLDVPVFVHPVLAPIGYKLLQDYDLPRVLGREVDLTVATTRLIAGGVLDRVPQLKLVIAHFGGGIAAVKDRLLAKAYRFGTLKRSFADYFEMLYFDLAGFEGGLPALHCALLGIRPERLLFASDYPQDFTGVNTDTGKGMQELRRYIDTIQQLPLGEEAKDGILGSRAIALLKV
jgi:predicted TIM-barrel fold metal-dependent hydrolase